MKIRQRYLIGALLLILCLLGVTLHKTQAQSGGGYDLTWNTLESGGPAAALDGGYSLSGNFGQPDASASLNGSGYSLTGGFWSGIPAYRLSLPAIFKE
jgi:hypothetical protein